MNKNKQTEFANLTELSVSNGAGLIIHKKIEILDINETLAGMFGYQYDQLTGNGITVLDLIEPNSRGMVLRNTLVKYGRLYDATGLRQDGSTFPIKILDQPVAGQDTSTRIMMITAITGQIFAEESVESLQDTRQNLEEKLNRTTTQLRFTNKQLQLELDDRVQIEAELRVRARQQAAVAELGQKALTGAELATLFTDAVSSVAGILESAYVAIFELSPNKKKLKLQVGQGWSSDLIGQATVDLQPDNPVGNVFYASETAILAGSEIETCFKQSSLFSENELISGINLAIHGYGVLGVYSTACRIFTDDDLHFLQAIANILAVVIERTQTDEQIRASVQEKEVLLREIHHRVKNNLQVVSSLINLQIDCLVDQQALETLKDSQNQIRSMALVHEKLYRSENLAEIDIGDYIKDLAAYLSRFQNASLRGITINIQTDDIFLDIDAALPCGLIINELVSNALKHAFPNGQTGEIIIKMRRSSIHHLTLTVSDNGVGFPPELDFRETETLGLQLVNTLVDQLDGTLEISTIYGTEVKITFPVSDKRSI